MPCTYIESPQEIAARDKQYREKLDKVTRMLCAVMTALEETKTVYTMSDIPGLTEWWDKHKKADEDRRAAEIKKKYKKIEELREQIDKLSRGED